MITKLRIKNFKCFEDTGEINIRPLTFLMGPNSAGKSSILQPLLLLRQTVDSTDVTNPLNISNPYVNMGSYTDLVFKHEYRYRNVSIEFHFTHRLVRKKDEKGLGSVQKIGFQTEFGYNKKTGQILLQKTKLEDFSTGNKVEIARVKGKYKSQISLSNQRTIELLIKPFKFYAIRSILKTKKKVEKQEETDFFKIANFLFRQIDVLFSRVFYIGPLREQPKRIYAATGQSPEHVGLKGEFSVDVLWVQSRQKKSREFLIGKINKWIQEFGFVSKIKLSPLGKNNYLLNLVIPSTNLTVNLADVGFGVSQVLPVIIEGYYSPPRSMLLIEQPEIHLHPKAQANLGDLLIDIAKSGLGKVLIVETHSEHLISRIQRRIAEGALKKEQVAIYYFNPTGTGTEINEIPLNELGQFEGEGLPEGFFEEGYKESIEHFKAMVKKQNNNG